MRRSTLDAILVQQARSAGVDVRTGTKVTDIVTRNEAVAGVVDQRGAEHAARVVVGADGRRSTVARLVGAVDEERHAPARAMYYRYATGWRSPDPVGPEFLLQGHRFSYVFPSDAGVACLAVSVTGEEHLLSRGEAAGLLEDTFRSNPQTATRMDEIEWVSGTYAGLPADSVWRAGCGPGWALVGDAGTMQDPWAGLGMDTAALQAEAFVEAFRQDTWTSVYSELRKERTYQGYAETTRLAPDLRRLIG